MHKSWGSVDHIGHSPDHESAGTAVLSTTDAANTNEEDTFEHIHKRSGDVTQYTGCSYMGSSVASTAIAAATATAIAAATATAIDSPRDSISSTCSSNLNLGYSSMPTTPSQLRSSLALGSMMDGASGGGAIVDSDSDSACGFDSHWSIHKSNNSLTRHRFQ